MNNYIVLEKVDPSEYNGKLYIVRAAQRTLVGALRYTGEDRVLVHYECYLALYKKDTY